MRFAAASDVGAGRGEGEKGDDGGVKPLQSKEARNCVRLSPDTGKRRYTAIARSLDNDSMKLFSRVRFLFIFLLSPLEESFHITTGNARQQVRLRATCEKVGRGVQKRTKAERPRAHVRFIHYPVCNLLRATYISRLITIFTGVPIAKVVITLWRARASTVIAGLKGETRSCSNRREYRKREEVVTPMRIDDCSRDPRETASLRINLHRDLFLPNFPAFTLSTARYYFRESSRFLNSSFACLILM